MYWNRQIYEVQTHTYVGRILTDDGNMRGNQKPTLISEDAFKMRNNEKEMRTEMLCNITILI